MKVINDPKYFRKRARLIYTGPGLSAFVPLYSTHSALLYYDKIELILDFGFGGELEHHIAYCRDQGRTVTWFIRLEDIEQITGVWAAVDAVLGTAPEDLKNLPSEVDRLRAAIRSHKDSTTIPTRLDQELYAHLPENQE